MHPAKVLVTPKGSGTRVPSAKSYFNDARGMAPLRGNPSVLGEACREEPRQWIVMEICGEMVQSPIQVSHHVHVSLLQGGQYRHQNPAGVGPASDIPGDRAWASCRTSYAGTAPTKGEHESAYTNARLPPSDLHVVGLNRFHPVYVGNFNLEGKPARRYFHLLTLESRPPDVGPK
jgi:hypothetical protein